MKKTLAIALCVLATSCSRPTLCPAYKERVKHERGTVKSRPTDPYKPQANRKFRVVLGAR